MNRIYFDNAATTPLAKEVFEEMLPYFTEHFGNPSSIYSYGRETRMAIEKQRKLIAQIIHAKPSEIFFTSGGTESTNTAIHSACRDLKCTHLITSPIEHHATLHSITHYSQMYDCKISYVKLKENGHIDLAHLERLLAESKEQCLVSLMHANNEIGNVTDIISVGKICKTHNAFFHTDAVQSIGHFQLNIEEIGAHFLSASAHKFHGPKGIGFLYIKGGTNIKPLLVGGSQERNMRAGTENVAGIIGMGKAIDMAYQDLEQSRAHILSLKHKLKSLLEETIPNCCFHGDLADTNLYTVLNVGFPQSEKTQMLSIHLDIAGICVSSGSACSSGAQGISHVIQHAYPHSKALPIRFSFSHFNTLDEVEFVAKKIVELV
ncbi:MAG TPA: cysteine desulfurase family protein [Chitinophagaceae bacterium]|nr:cysteine desulfurase family protein [Chitinophagaceae bacterium]